MKLYKSDAEKIINPKLKNRKSKIVNRKSISPATL